MTPSQRPTAKLVLDDGPSHSEVFAELMEARSAFDRATREGRDDVEATRRLDAASRAWRACTGTLN